jgi:hypothetical protein
MASVRQSLPFNLVPVLLIAGTLSTSLARADVAVLREKGPKSGTLFANPGIVAGAPDAPRVTMRTANVRIQLRAGGGGNLAADCVADFELADLAPRPAETPPLLVAFPVTGLRSKVVTVEKFNVTVDGESPPTVLRRSITVSKGRAKLEDTPVHGMLDDRFSPQYPSRSWAVFLTDETGYRDAYVWQQKVNSSGASRIRVSYTVILRPQSIHYSKSYSVADDDREVIPFQDLQVDKWEDRYFFFDYVLLSGATWDGPIGSETIRVSADPALRLNIHRIESFMRQPAGIWDRYRENTHVIEEPSRRVRNGIATWELRNEEPTCDLLLAIPASAVTLE